jgi:hypothetical protein
LSAKCSYARVLLCSECAFLNCYAECRYVECHYIKSHYAECRGASWKAFPVSRAEPFRSKVGSLPPQKH